MNKEYRSKESLERPSYVFPVGETSVRHGFYKVIPLHRKRREVRRSRMHIHSRLGETLSSPRTSHARLKSGAPIVRCSISGAPSQAFPIVRRFASEGFPHSGSRSPRELFRGSLAFSINKKVMKIRFSPVGKGIGQDFRGFPSEYPAGAF